MVGLSNPGTYGTRKCSSWCADIHKSKDPEYKHPEIQHSKNPKIQNFLHLQNLAIVFGFLDFWILGFFDFGFGDFGALGFLDFWIFCVLHLCFQSVETAPKLDSEENGVCIGIYSVFRGCACRRG